MSVPELIELGEALKGCRKRAGLDVAMAAFRLKISESYVRMIEHGERVPSPAVLERISELYGIQAAMQSVVVVEGMTYTLGRAYRVHQGRHGPDWQPVDQTLVEILELLRERLPGSS